MSLRRMTAANLASKPNRRALADWAIEHLYDLIFTGQLPAGADLGEEALSERLEVSRATVSVALRQLEQDGLATVAAGNGRRAVATFGVDDVQDLYNVRAVLEGYAAKIAAPRMTDEILAKLSSLQVEMENLSREVAKPDRRDFGVDFEFHRTIVRAAGSRRIETSLSPIWIQTHALLRHLHSIGAYANAAEDNAAYRDHREIIGALENRAGNAAAAAMTRHLSGRRHQLVEGLRDSGQFSSTT